MVFLVYYEYERFFFLSSIYFSVRRFLGIFFCRLVCGVDGIR